MAYRRAGVARALGGFDERFPVPIARTPTSHSGAPGGRVVAFPARSTGWWRHPVRPAPWHVERVQAVGQCRRRAAWHVIHGLARGASAPRRDGPGWVVCHADDDRRGLRGNRGSQGAVVTGSPAVCALPYVGFASGPALPRASCGQRIAPGPANARRRDRVDARHRSGGDPTRRGVWHRLWWPLGRSVPCEGTATGATSRPRCCSIGTARSWWTSPTTASRRGRAEPGVRRSSGCGRQAAGWRWCQPERHRPRLDHRARSRPGERAE